MRIRAVFFSDQIFNREFSLSLKEGTSGFFFNKQNNKWHSFFYLCSFFVVVKCCGVNIFLRRCRTNTLRILIKKKCLTIFIYHAYVKVGKFIEKPFWDQITTIFVGFFLDGWFYNLASIDRLYQLLLSYLESRIFLKLQYRIMYEEKTNNYDKQGL